MIDPHADPALVVGHVVDSVRDRLAQFLILEVVDANFLRLAFGMPFATAVLEIPHQFLLFRVDRDHRLPTLLEARRLGVDVLELSIAIGMLVAFARLAVGLQAVAGFVQQPRHRTIADPMALTGQLRRQPASALAGPTQGRHRIAPRQRFQQRLQGGNQRRVGLRQAFASRPSLPQTLGHRFVGMAFTILQFPQSPRRSCHERIPWPGDRRHAAVSIVSCLRRCPLAPRPFIQDSIQRVKLEANPFDDSCILHDSRA